MAAGTFQLPPDSTGKVIRTQTNAGVDSGAHQQVVTIADGTGDVIPGLAAAPAVGAEGLVTRPLVEDTTATGTITANGQTVVLAVGAGQTLGTVDLRGTWAVGTTVSIEGTLDGTNYVTMYTRNITSDSGIGNGANFPSTANPVMAWFYIGGLHSFRVRCTAFVATSSITATLRATAGYRDPMISAATSTGDTSIFEPGIHTRVLPNAQTKGTQESRGFQVQRLQDAGRVHVSWYANSDTGVVTGPTTEAMMTMRQSRDGATATTASSFTVTSGKRLRLSTLVVTGRHSAAATGRTVLRWTSTGAVGTTSPIILAASYAVAANDYFAVPVPIPEGFELSGTMQFGVSNQGSLAFAELNVQLNGFEY